MKTKSFISFAACVAASVLMCGCSNEESAEGNGQLTAFTGGVVTEAPMERVQIGTSESSTVVPGIGTRTSMNREKIGGEGVFLWEPNDVIYVEDDGGKLHKSQNTITEKAPRATFLLDGSYTANSQYDVYYCGTNSAAGDKKVVIAGNQTQEAFNNTKHFGASGDCGVAKAEKITVSGKSGYKFDLEHKASYLCFLPYIPSEEERESYKIQSIEITSDNNIAGTYDLTQSGLSGEGESKTITLHVGDDPDDNGLELADQSTGAKSINNSLYAVIAPGPHALKVKYTVLDTKTNAVITMTKSYGSHNFAANKICDIPVSICAAALDGGHKNAGSDVLADLYSGYNYYMWDARENYWSGHEWDSAEPWQPTEINAKNDNYAKSNADPRWYHEGSGAFEASVNPLFKQLPNANEMAWYVLKGDAHWDNTTRWEAFGKTHTGGIWLKKLSVIAKENGKELAALKQADPNGKNLLQIIDSYSFNPGNGKPADSEIGKYFFLPALSYYSFGQLANIGSCGTYWSSTAHPSESYSAYTLYFSENAVNVGFYGRGYRPLGFVAHPFE